MKYKIAAIFFLLTTMLLVILVLHDKSVLKKSVIQTYNQWSSEINMAQSVLDTGPSSPTNNDIDAIHLGYDAFNLSHGRISGSITFPSPAQETKGMLANLCFELHAEFNGLINSDHPATDRKFLASQFEQVTHNLPQTVTNIHQLNGMNKKIEGIIVSLNKNYTNYLRQS
jgi:hypothetical protein